jgi:hypothetical protein
VKRYRGIERAAAVLTLLQVISQIMTSRRLPEGFTLEQRGGLL